MKKNLLFLAGALVALAFNSCAYDPYYSSSSISGSYSSGYGGGGYGGGYGDGYGYGGNSFSTSVFVSTGDPRWGYDPNCYSYYDYRSRRYYDPYLNGYYPVGYRPPVVYGVPHPHGWRPGRGHLPPPSYVGGGVIRNYRDRESAYRGTRYGWAKQVRQQRPSGPVGTRPSQGGGGYGGGGRQEAGRPGQATRPSGPNFGGGQPQRERTRQTQGRQDPRQNSSSQQRSRQSPYNNQVVNAGQQGRQRSASQGRGPGGRQMSPPQGQGGRQSAPRGNSNRGGSNNDRERGEEGRTRSR